MQTIQLAQPPGEHPLDTSARLLGGRGALGEKLGVSPAAIGNWKLRGVPIEHCYPIEKATCGLITRRDLRPDDWQEIWPELTQVATKAANEPAAAPHGV